MSVLVIGKSQSWISLAEFTESAEIFSCEKNFEEPPGEEKNLLPISTSPVYISIVNSFLFSISASVIPNILLFKFPERRGPPNFT